MQEPLIIWLDFDGTVVEHTYPLIGQLNPNAVEVIKKIRKKGHRLILNTTRVEFNNGTFEKALAFLQEQGIEIKEFTSQKLYPLTFNLENMRLYREMYIDDTATHIPLRFCKQAKDTMVD